MNTTAEAPASPVIPSAIADGLADGDQRAPTETKRQTEVLNSSLPLEVVAQEDENDHDKEKDQGNVRQAQRSDGELEKMRIDFELIVLKHQHEENDKQRQHEEKMEQLRQQTATKKAARGEEEQLAGKLDPITEIELEKMRMEFELTKLKHISEENERQRQHEQKMLEDKEKQRQHEEKMEQMCQRHGPFRVVSQRATGDKAEAAAETSSVASAEVGKMRIEIQLGMQIYLQEINEKKPPNGQSGQKEGPKLEKSMKNASPTGKPQVPPEQQLTDSITEHLGLQVPRIMVSGAEAEWSGSRLDLAIETELEKRRMEFELTRLKYEHDENQRQRQHEEKMEQLRQQALPKETGKLANKEEYPRASGNESLTEESMP